MCSFQAKLIQLKLLDLQGRRLDFPLISRPDWSGVCQNSQTWVTHLIPCWGTFSSAGVSVKSSVFSFLFLFLHFNVSHPLFTASRCRRRPRTGWESSRGRRRGRRRHRCWCRHRRGWLLLNRLSPSPLFFLVYFTSQILCLQEGYLCWMLSMIWVSF